MQRLLPPYLFLILSAVMVGCAVIEEGRRIFDGPARWLGVAVIAGGLAFNLWGARTFASVDTNIRTFDDPGMLVTSGPFRITRNPMYVGFTVALLGFAALLDRWVAIIGPILFVVIADRWYIRFEERRMAEVFGDTYTAYRSEVRRWL